MEFYSAMKKNENLSLADKWMELENITLSEVSQAQKTKISFEIGIWMTGWEKGRSLCYKGLHLH
jgi:hypothetical protein